MSKKPNLPKSKSYVNVLVDGELSSPYIIVDLDKKAVLHVNKEHRNYDLDRAIIIKGNVKVKEIKINNRMVVSKLKVL